MDEFKDEQFKEWQAILIVGSILAGIAAVAASVIIGLLKLCEFLINKI